RGYSVGLAEKNDFASGTSSWSTKLIHGGLRYLEHYEFRLVREALIEREVLLQAMPHISWPMRFVLPYHEDMRFESTTPTSRLLSLILPWTKGRRPAWLIRLGLLLYDTMGGRRILPGTKTLNLTQDPAGRGLNPKFKKAYEYSDCWVEDSRLVVLNARDAATKGATILTRRKVVSAERGEDLWQVTLEDTATGAKTAHKARALVNAGGPWVEDVTAKLGRNRANSVRLVRGSHIVFKRLFDHDKCYFFQGEDGRIMFAIPYETDFTLIGTTDEDHPDADVKPECTPEEQQYMCDFVSKYLDRPIMREDIVWTYSGVRPLYSDGTGDATATSRDYTLSMDDACGAPLLNVFGGKITTYRKLAEHALEKLAPHFPNAADGWTAGAPLPGGDFTLTDMEKLTASLQTDYPFLTRRWATRLMRAYGTEAWAVLGDARTEADLGGAFGATLTEAEVRWMMTREYARTADDVIWRRTKLGLRMTKDEIAALSAWMADHSGLAPPVERTLAPFDGQRAHETSDKEEGR
ncbi:MAG: glycerol-3-phosphate dehydrogenase, partial [Pseudomonadota bacterium]